MQKDLNEVCPPAANGRPPTLFFQMPSVVIAVSVVCTMLVFSLGWFARDLVDTGSGVSGGSAGLHNNVALERSADAQDSRELACLGEGHQEQEQEQEHEQEHEQQRKIADEPLAAAVAVQGELEARDPDPDPDPDQVAELQAVDVPRRAKPEGDSAASRSVRERKKPRNRRRTASLYPLTEEQRRQIQSQRRKKACRLSKHAMSRSRWRLERSGCVCRISAKKPSSRSRSMRTDRSKSSSLPFSPSRSHSPKNACCVVLIASAFGRGIRRQHTCGDSRVVDRP